jgi:hypothetical protein
LKAGVYKICTFDKKLELCLKHYVYEENLKVIFLY